MRDAKRSVTLNVLDELRGLLIEWRERVDRGLVRDPRDWQTVFAEDLAIEAAEEILSGEGFEFGNSRARAVYEARQDRRLDAAASLEVF